MPVIFLFRQGKGTREVWRLSSSFNAVEAEIGRHKPYDFGSIMRKINGRRFCPFFISKRGSPPSFEGGVVPMAEAIIYITIVMIIIVVLCLKVKK